MKERYVVDASVVLRWFVREQETPRAMEWLERFVRDPHLLIAPDLLLFEVYGGLARLQPRRDPKWAERSFLRFQRLGVRLIPTTRKVFLRALELSSEMKLGGYDTVYLALAESLDVAWLTADAKAVRRMGRDRRVLQLG